MTTCIILTLDTILSELSLTLKNLNSWLLQWFDILSINLHKMAQQCFLFYIYKTSLFLIYISETIFFIITESSKKDF